MAVELYDRLDSVAEPWDALADATGARPWLRPGWFRAWSRAFRPRALRILTVRSGGELTGVLPLVGTTGAIASATNFHSPAFGLVAADEDSRRELAEGLIALRPTRIRLSRLEPESGLAECLDAASGGGFRVVLRRFVQSPYVVLGARDGDAPGSAEPGRKRRKSMERARVALSRLGAVELDVRDGRSDLDALLDEGFALEGSGWKTERGTAIESDPIARAFYVDLARWASDAGMLCLSFLRVGGRAIAFKLILDDGRSMYDVKGGYDVEFRRYGPGFLIADALFGEARARGRETFELLGEVEPFKLEWTSHVRERVTFEAFARTPAGAFGYAASSYGRPLAKRIVALVRR